MRWRGREQSENVRDIRGQSPGKMAAGGGLGMLVIALIAMFLGKDPAPLLEKQKQRQAQANAQAQKSGTPQKQDDYGEFIGVTLKLTEDVWDKQFAAVGQRYKKPELKIFSNNVTTQGCGAASSAMGPFYCPADQRVYIDPTFFDELATRHKSKGDMAWAFVIAHEVGHHIQNLLKWNQRANQARRSGNKILANQESVRLELQADYLAGVWAHHAHKEENILESGDIEEAITAAINIGDDVLQARAGVRVDEKNFTHGSGEQRRRWFLKGIRSGNFAEAERVFLMDYDDL